MELTLTVHLPRRRPRAVDVVVDWEGPHTAADLCAALAEHLREPVGGLRSDGRAVDPSVLVGMPPLLHGASVTVTTGSGAERDEPQPAGVLDLVVVGGPDAGRSRALVPPGFAVGRAAVGGLVVADASLSRVHALVRVSSSGVTVADAGSTNGVVVDGSPLGTEPRVVDTTSTIVMGSTTLRLRRAPGPGPVHRERGDGTIAVRPAGGSVPVAGPVEVECPPVPPERPPTRVPWVAALAPVPVAVALAVFLGPQLLAFALLGPFALLVTAVADRWGTGRARRREREAHARAVAAAHARLDLALAEEAARLHRAHPDPHTVLVLAEGRLAPLWSDGPTIRVRLGLGDVPTRVTWIDGPDREQPVARGVPVVVDLDDVGGLAVIGPLDVTDRLLAGLVGQLCTTHPPRELAVAVAGRDPSWDWVARLPHVVDAPELLGAGSTATHRVMVVPGGDARGSAVAARARVEGILVLVAVRDAADVPAGCRAVLSRSDGHDAFVLDAGPEPLPVTLDLVGPWWTERLSRALAPLREAGGGGSGGALPRRVSLPEVLGVRDITVEHVLDRWQDPAPGGRHDIDRSPSAAVGVTTGGAPHRIDLARDGPHVLVGGTTGSGKSEFLCTLVTSLAVSAPPEQLTFVLVDFKGGSAFAACAALPHVVGLVTDLDDHLVDRALSSLRAELRRRERLFARVGARDLADHRRLCGPEDEPVPRLVVVVDELRALVDEVPDFVSGLVRLAALGRSLGVHLVLATQRPSGALTAEIQANVNLRIAFRVRDRADSVDVLEDPAAAGISPSTPGRALARGGDGELVRFQAATVLSPGRRAGRSLTVSPAGSERDDADAGPAAVAPTTALVGALREAHRRRGGVQPRSPWLAPLPDRLPWAAPSSGGGTPVEVALGVVDEPDLQRVSPLRWAPSDGTWVVTGRPRSGRTTALRALVLSAASTLDPTRLHVHVVDPSATWSDVDALPHVGTRVGVTDLRALDALVTHLRDEVSGRAQRSTQDQGWPTVLVVVDGWEQLVDALPPAFSEDVVGRLLGVFRDGGAVGVVGAVAGGRSLLQPRWTAIAACTFLVGAVDPLDAAVTGLRAADLPRDPPRGRAVRVHDRREVQFTSPSTDDTERVASVAGPRPAVGAAWRLLPLPAVVRRRAEPRAVAGRAGEGVEESPGLAVGVTGPSLDEWSWRPMHLGRRLLVAGPAGSGRSNVLRVLSRAALTAGRPVLVVTDHGGHRRFPGAVVVGFTGVGTLVDVRRRHPDLLLLVDDADRLDDATVLPALREVVELVDRDRGLVAVTTTSTSLSTRFRGLDVDVARHRAGILLMPTPADADLLGARRLDEVPRMPGRGVVVGSGRATEIQVFLADEDASAGVLIGGPGPGNDLGVGLPGDPGGDSAGEGHENDHPADEREVALHQTHTHREEQHAPHQGRGPWPRAVAEPPAGEEDEPCRADEDEQGRHHHPGGVAALTGRQLVEVEGHDGHEGQALNPEEHGRDPSGAA